MFNMIFDTGRRKQSLILNADGTEYEPNHSNGSEKPSPLVNRSNISPTMIPIPIFLKIDSLLGVKNNFRTKIHSGESFITISQ